MDESVLDNQFDMEKYINQRLLEVKHLEDKVMLKEVLNDLLLEMYHLVEQQYTELEHRVFDELDRGAVCPPIITNIIEKQYYDITDEYLRPMDENDLNEAQIDMLLLKESLEINEPFFVYSVFIEQDYMKLKELIRKERLFSGTAKTEYGEYRATFLVKISGKYMKMLESLYEICLLNYMPWHTICAPYLYKIFDVYIMKVEGLQEAEKIQEIKVNFEEFTDNIHYDMVPLWNVSHIEEKTSTFPEACIDEVHHQHILFQKGGTKDTEYLVASRDVEISNIRKLNGDLIITCTEANNKKWLLYKINTVPLKRRPYPIMSNELKESFSMKLKVHYQSYIKTKTELMRYICELGYEEYVHLKDVEVIEDAFIEQETYSMNAFIADEIRLSQKAQQLVLKFIPLKTDDYLIRDIMSYLVSCVAYIYPEYKCVGKLV